MSAPAALGVVRPTVRIRGTPYPVVLPSWRDPRLHLAAVIVSLQVLGQVAFEFRLSIAQILVSLLTCAVLEAAIAFRRQRVFLWPASALLTGNGVAFILRVPGTEHGDWWSMRGAWIFAGTSAVALLSKHLIRLRGRHLLNPSNIGLVLCFLVLGAGRAEPLDFWWAPMSGWMVLALSVIVAGGLAILARLKLLGIAIGFWLAFAAGIGVLAASGHEMTARWHLGPITGWSFWWALVSSPEILVFLFFMITDPKTIPDGRVARRVYAAGVGLLAALVIAPLTTEYATKVAVLGALAVFCAARPLLEWLFPAAGPSPVRLRTGTARRATAGALALAAAVGVHRGARAGRAAEPLECEHRHRSARGRRPPAAGERRRLEARRLSDRRAHGRADRAPRGLRPPRGAGRSPPPQRRARVRGCDRHMARRAAAPDPRGRGTRDRRPRVPPRADAAQPGAGGRPGAGARRGPARGDGGARDLRALGGDGRAPRGSRAFRADARAGARRQPLQDPPPPRRSGARHGTRAPVGHRPARHGRAARRRCAGRARFPAGRVPLRRHQGHDGDDGRRPLLARLRRRRMAGPLRRQLLLRERHRPDADACRPAAERPLPQPPGPVRGRQPPLGSGPAGAGKRLRGGRDPEPGRPHGSLRDDGGVQRRDRRVRRAALEQRRRNLRRGRARRGDQHAGLARRRRRGRRER